MQDDKPENNEAVQNENTEELLQETQSNANQAAIVQLLTNEKFLEMIKLLLANNKSSTKWDSGPRYLLAAVAVCGGLWLSYFGKFEPSIAVLLGSIVGYTLGKDK